MPKDKGLAYRRDQVVAEGERIVIPERCGEDARALGSVIEALQRLLQYNTERTDAVFEFKEAWPQDGAYIAAPMLDEHFGFLLEKRHASTTLQLELGAGETVTIPWGQFEVPGVDDATFEFESGRSERGMFFIIRVYNVRRADLARVERFMDALRARFKKDSLYRGKAIEFRGMNTPQFIDVSGTPMPIFRSGIEQALDVTLYAPIRYAEQAKKQGVPTKRGIVLDGKYGTGKTITAQRAALECVAAGRTFVMCGEGESVSAAFEFANIYGPSLLFVEDIDRVANERDETLNELLNVLDGVNTKQSDVIVVMTTNHLDRVHPSLLREGRVDARITLRRPDAEAVGRLFVHYGAPNCDEAAGILAGQTPAAVREAVERAKLAAIHFSEGVSAVVTDEALVAAAHSVVSQHQVKYTEKESPVRAFADHLVGAVFERLQGRVIGHGKGARMTEAFNDEMAALMLELDDGSSAEA